MKNQSGSEERPLFLSTHNNVYLTPSWKLNKSSDELKYEETTMKEEEKSLTTPKDKWKIVFLIFILHGLGTLMPWNMFITAKDYFVDFKLDTHGTNSTNYGKNYLQYVGFAAQIPNLLFQWVNIFVNLGGDLTQRIVYSILAEILVFIITIILAMMDSSDWPGIFFWITMASVVILNIANGIYQNTIYGMAAILPVKYTGAVVLGSNISGLFATIVSILSTYIFSSPRTSAIYYFLTAILVILICFDTYFALPLNKFFRYHKMMHVRAMDKNVNINVHRTIPYWSIFKQAFPQLFNVFFTFFISLSIFPAVHSDIKASNEQFFLKDLFSPITCFLTFNLFAMLGSLATSWIQLPKADFLYIPVLLRVLFLPLFLFCNYHPTDQIRMLQIFITNDWVYWIIAILMSFSSGYLSSLGMMYAPRTVGTEHQLTAGMFAAAMLITGIFAGILFSFVCPIIVTNLKF